MKPFYVVICCDTDPDRPDFGGTYLDKGLEKQVWQGVESIFDLRPKLEHCKDSQGRSIPITWLLRCDENIFKTHGDMGFLIKTYIDHWKRLESNYGDEIGWHPHFYRLSEDKKSWYHETKDPEYNNRCLSDGYEQFEESWGQTPKSVRMGWCYHDNHSMATLSKLGVRIDCSAMPKQSFAGAFNDRGAPFIGAYNWKESPESAYYPGENSYQTSGEAEEKLEILELPCAIYSSFFAQILSELRVSVREKKIKNVFSALSSKEVYHTTIKACAPTFLFKSMVKQLLDKGSDWCVTYFHPDEWLPEKGSLVNNHLHQFKHIEQNLSSLRKLCEAHNRECIALTAHEAAEKLEETWNL